MYLDMFLHVGHTVKILKKPRKNQCFSRVRTCDASFDVVIFACVFYWKRQYNQRVAHFFNMSVSKWSWELFWTSFGPLLDPFWIPFGDHLGDVLALVGLFGALFGRQSAVILFILASDKAPKRTSDTLLERLEPGKLALEPLHISLGPLQSYLDPSRSYFRASKHQFLIIQCSNRTYVACQKHLLIIIDQVIRPPILGLFDLGEPLSFLAA